MGELILCYTVSLCIWFCSSIDTGRNLALGKLRTDFRGYPPEFWVSKVQLGI
jgi:hypothetical protein